MAAKADKNVLMNGLVTIIGWALVAFGCTYIFMGFYNDWNFGATWSCPGIYYPGKTNIIECITPYTLTVEVPTGLVLLVIGIVLLVVASKYMKGKK